MIKEDLIGKIRSHRAVIGIIGLGYVGLPLVLRFGEEKFSILGFDVDEEKVRKLNAGESYIRHIDGKRLLKLRQDLGDTEPVVQLTGTYHNLLRQWAET